MLRPMPLRRYLNRVNAQGIATDQVVTRAGLDLDALDAPHYLIDEYQYLGVVDHLVELTGSRGLGLDIGLAFDIKDSGVLGYASLSCRSIRQSVEEFWGGYGDALGVMAKLSITAVGDETVAIEVSAPSMSLSAYRFFVEDALCMLLKGGLQVSGVPAHFLKLEFSYPAPRYVQRYREIFGCPMVFDAPRTRATLSREWFERPLASSDPELVHLYRQHLLQLQQQIEASNPLLARLRNIFIRRNGEIPLLDEAARELRLSPRTLRRQLQQQGYSYRGLAATFRTELALECLKTGAAATKQISERLGFEDVNAFRRAFKGWTGKTIGQYRRGH